MADLITSATKLALNLPTRSGTPQQSAIADSALVSAANNRVVGPSAASREIASLLASKA